MEDFAQVGRPELSIVSPVYGCAGCLEALVDRIEIAVRQMGKTFEIILVDDSSPDGSWVRILELSAVRGFVRGIRLSRNFGQHYAISAGIEHALGDVIVVMDCDLQDVPEEIPALVSRCKSGTEVVFGKRLDRQDSVLKRAGSFYFFKLLSWMTGVKQDHTTANFGAYSRKVIDTVNAMPERERCFPLMVKWTGFNSVSIPVAHDVRENGRSGYSFSRLLNLAIGIILSYSDKPLRMVVNVGLAFALIAFLMVLWSIVRYIGGDVGVAGFTSTIASIWLVGGVAISCIGITGLYLGRLFNDAKARPYYIVSEDTKRT